MTAAGSGASGIVTFITGHSGATAMLAAAGFGMAVNLPKIFESIYKRRPAIIRARGEAKARVIEAKAKRIEAEIKKINAVSDARDSAKRTDVQAKMLLTAQKKSGNVEATIALLKQQRPPPSPKEKNNSDPDPGRGSPNVRPFRRLWPHRRHRRLLGWRREPTPRSAPPPSPRFLTAVLRDPRLASDSERASADRLAHTPRTGSCRP